MYNKDMEELNIKLWEAEYKRCRAEEERLKKVMDDDPTTMLLDCHSKFNDLLKKYTGKERLTPQFKAEVDKLARKEKRAKTLRDNGYDMMKAMDAYHEAKFHADNVLQELNMFKFRYKLHHIKDEKKRDAMIVEKAVEKAEKATK